ncbi:MAG: F0F1 ATP synthase subunit epsilon [Clostridia bacterium]|jgi:F-type H+-transporting ATPase subunit epsilon|nr:F0F1 ATP synthase subunit epsilon [Clostridia bacterium]
MAGQIMLEVVTPERKVFSEEVSGIVVPATEGSLGVLSNHAPLITGLQIGVIKFTQEGKIRKMAISGGFMEVKENKVIVLADTAELGSEIDVLRAKEAKERAEKRLTDREASIDYGRVHLALHRALARLKAGDGE